MASKKLRPYLEAAKKYIISENYETYAADETHGPGTYCHLEVGNVPVLRFFGAIETEATTYFNPTDARGYSADEGKRIAFERALKQAAEKLRGYAILAEEDLAVNNNAISYVATELLRAMVALEHASDYSYQVKRKDQEVIGNAASVARCEIADMAARFLDQKDANLRKLARLRKLVNG